MPPGSDLDGAQVQDRRAQQGRCGHRQLTVTNRRLRNDLPHCRSRDRFRAQPVPDAGNARAEHMGRGGNAESLRQYLPGITHVTKRVRGLGLVLGIPHAGAFVRYGRGHHGRSGRFGRQGHPRAAL
jgi:hypothetical protein